MQSRRELAIIMIYEVSTSSIFMILKQVLMSSLRNFFQEASNEFQITDYRVTPQKVLVFAA